MLGDYGFDPLRLGSKDKVGARSCIAELVVGRCCHYRCLPGSDNEGFCGCRVAPAVAIAGSPLLPPPRLPPGLRGHICHAHHHLHHPCRPPARPQDVLKYYREGELTNGRWAMAAVAG